MSHDLSLGPPVDVGVDEQANHSGPCFDGVYGCHRCWNAANDGKGESFTCDWCKREDVFTLVLRSLDEPVLYAICDECQERRQQYARELQAEYDAADWDYETRCDDDTEPEPTPQCGWRFPSDEIYLTCELPPGHPSTQHEASTECCRVRWESGT